MLPKFALVHIRNLFRQCQFSLLPSFFLKQANNITHHVEPIRIERACSKAVHTSTLNMCVRPEMHVDASVSSSCPHTPAALSAHRLTPTAADKVPRAQASPATGGPSISRERYRTLLASTGDRSTTNSLHHPQEGYSLHQRTSVRPAVSVL